MDTQCAGALPPVSALRGNWGSSEPWLPSPLGCSEAGPGMAPRTACDEVAGIVGTLAGLSPLCCHLHGLDCPLQPPDLLPLPSSPNLAVGSLARMCSQLWSRPRPQISVGWLWPLWAAGTWASVLGIVCPPGTFSISDQMRFCLGVDHGAFAFPE